MKPPKKDNASKAIAKLNDLYITTRRKYLVQTESGYITLDRSNNSSIWTLNDGMLKRHLDGKNTYGVFNANAVSKFITFDVDYADDMGEAKRATKQLTAMLVVEFNIPLEDIHVSISGGKGYHVDLFFDRALPIETVQSFYNNVLKSAGLSTTRVEFRPTWSQGVKLPLGIHQRTGNRCWYVDNRTLEPIKNFGYLNDVEPMPASIIEDGAIVLTEEQETEFLEIVERTDTTVTAVNDSKAMQKAADILDEGRLIATGSRHSTTLTLAKFFNSQGWEQSEAIDAIMTVLHNTPREYFSKGSTPEHWKKEAERIVNLAYDRNYTLGNADRPITIYKSEILAVLSVGTFRQKQLAYAMLATSKRYGRVFYLTVNSAMEMIDTNSRETVQNAVTKLVEGGFIEYTRKGEIDRARSAELGRPYSKPNMYRLLIDEPADDEESVEVVAEQTIIEVAKMLCSEEEIRGKMGRREYENRWRSVS